jgi:hypothetical protein
MSWLVCDLVGWLVSYTDNVITFFLVVFSCKLQRIRMPTDDRKFICTDIQNKPTSLFPTETTYSFSQEKGLNAKILHRI